MFFFKIKNHINFLIVLFVILTGCQMEKPLKTHGLIYLENRSNTLQEKKNNKNDVIKLMGKPHITSFDSPDIWIYVERTLTKGSYHKLGKNIIKNNNVLVLKFDKYGILAQKDLFTKEDLNKMKFSKDKTENELSKTSFMQSFLESVRQKMYKK